MSTLAQQMEKLEAEAARLYDTVRGVTMVLDTERSEFAKREEKLKRQYNDECACAQKLNAMRAEKDERIAALKDKLNTLGNHVCIGEAQDRENVKAMAEMRKRAVRAETALQHLQGCSWTGQAGTTARDPAADAIIASLKHSLVAADSDIAALRERCLASEKRASDLELRCKQQQIALAALRPQPNTTMPVWVFDPPTIATGYTWHCPNCVSTFRDRLKVDVLPVGPCAQCQHCSAMAYVPDSTPLFAVKL